MTTENTTFSPEDMDSIRERLADASGPEYWRSLDELSKTPAFQEQIHNEFPAMAASPADGVTRRNFLQVMGATLALAGVTGGCGRQPRESIFPYVTPPEDAIPGKPLPFATANVQGGYAKGILAESHMGRPTKIEGLPGHPSSLGRTDAQTQASILDLYDPDRSKAALKNGNPETLDGAIAAAKLAIADSVPGKGEGLRILSGTVTSPTLSAKLNDILKAYPNAKWHQYEPAGRDNVRAGAQQAFGEYVDTLYHFDKADIVVSLDSDFLDSGPANVRHAADYAHRRDVVDSHGDDHGEHQATLSRTYAFESTPTNVGAGADHRFPFRPSQIEVVARALAEGLGISALGGAESGLSAQQQGWIDAVAKDLQAHKGAGIVIVGDHQPAAVHALAHAINEALGNAGKTVEHIAPVETRPMNQLESLTELVADINAGSVETLIILGGNPAYNAPADLEFLEALKKVKNSIHLSPYLDETSLYSHWHIPELHQLETFGDARAFDGTVSLIQPLIAPLYGGQSALDFVSAAFDEEAATAHDLLQAQWKSRKGEDGFDVFWREALSKGSVDGTARKTKTRKVKPNAIASMTSQDAPGTSEFEIVFLPDPSVGDGTYSNNAWLQEVPNPLTKLTWDNAVILGFSTARDLGFKNEDLVEISYNDRTVRGPVWIHPGQASNTITVHLGYGRTAAGKVANGMGFNAYSILTSDAPTIGSGAQVKKLAGTFPLARTEEHYNMEGRELARHFTEEAYTADPGIVHAGHHTPDEHTTLLDPEEKKWDGYNWGMTFDLNQCTGCNACIVACQSENIIPVVGKTEVRIGREMQWIRVDRYFHAGKEKELNKLSDAELAAEYDNPKVYYQPIPCMQCENAPCEVVCPVGATQHSQEGLNDMVYNRCIGTRYCSNNCPYKVRRFNFYHYSRTPLGSRGDRINPTAFEETHVHPESLKPMRNPDVTVRSRGVMEKCTYCVQRINYARIESKKSGEGITDANCVTACQQACPSGAISFGDISNPETQVAKLKSSHRNYGILEDLNTRPRTTYLARITNPNPELSS